MVSVEETVMAEKPQQLTDENLRIHLTALYSGLQHVHQRIDELELTRDALLETLRDHDSDSVQAYEAKLESLKIDAENTRGCLQVHDVIELNIQSLRPKESK